MYTLQLVLHALLYIVQANCNQLTYIRRYTGRNTLRVVHAETAVKYGLLRYYPKCVPVTRQPKQDLQSYGI